MVPTWGRKDPGGPHIGPMNLAILDHIKNLLYLLQLTVVFVYHYLTYGLPYSWLINTIVCHKAMVFQDLWKAVWQAYHETLPAEKLLLAYYTSSSHWGFDNMATVLQMTFITFL